MADQAAGQILSMPSAPDAIELRHLRSFVAVAEELNFGRAAVRLHLSQPALSRQIRFLERLVACDLLHRTTRRVELTTAGQTLLEYARRILADVDRAIGETRAVGGELAQALSRHWDIFYGAGADGDLERFRNACEDLLAPFPLEPGISIRPITAGGVPSLVASPRPQTPITMLHLHGGGYIAGSAFGYRSLASALSRVADAAVIVPEYRLAPEHPFPGALEDAQYVYEWLLEAGREPEEVTLLGDSSGAGLALSLLLTLKQQGLPMPGRAVLMCPWLNLGLKYDRLLDGTITLEALRRAAGLYLAAAPVGDPLVDPLIDPLNADLSGLPALLIQAGTGEPILEDAERLSERASACGVDAALEIYPADTHSFQLFWSLLPAAVDALERVGRFVGGTGTLETRASA
jgi:acetyl esterase/lipase